MVTCVDGDAVALAAVAVSLAEADTLVVA